MTDKKGLDLNPEMQKEIEIQIETMKCKFMTYKNMGTNMEMKTMMKKVKETKIKVIGIKMSSQTVKTLGSHINKSNMYLK